MFLNETKPPLEEAVEHFGVRGMHWGIRKRRENGNPHPAAEDFSLEPDKPNKYTGTKVAVASVLIAGTVASALILKNHGSIPTSSFRMPTSPFAGKTFRPQNVGNPLFTVHPKTPKAAKSFVDAGFGKNNVFNVTTMTRGAKTVNDFDANVWDVPIRAITRGRK